MKKRGKQCKETRKAKEKMIISNKEKNKKKTT